jgi:predicted lipoprotein with Yx(FWY)xxD motif
MMNARRFALLLVALLMLAACGADDQAAGGDEAASEPAVAASAPADASEPAAPASEPAAQGGVTLEVSDTDLGQILVDGDGMTLYVFDNDSDGQSACTGDCASNWPPLTDEVAAGDGVDDSLLGMTERDDGTAQATYDNQPLYYFAGDQASGDTNGQGVGGIWWVVGPDGQKITGNNEAASIQY